MQSIEEEDEQMEHIIGKLLQDYERGKMTRRQLIQTLALTATAASTVRTAEAAPQLMPSTLRACQEIRPCTSDQ